MFIDFLLSLVFDAPCIVQRGEKDFTSAFSYAGSVRRLAGGAWPHTRVKHYGKSVYLKVQTIALPFLARKVYLNLEN